MSGITINYNKWGTSNRGITPGPYQKIAFRGASSGWYHLCDFLAFLLPATTQYAHAHHLNLCEASSLTYNTPKALVLVSQILLYRLGLIKSASSLQVNPCSAYGL